ncbi:hypothetical protein QBC42DRAFT_279238 [Cladorrhinum samala]|uniref:Secreted protein n=1 Tax=Cladorrhinum samala TaxID=585594 RepID=A0AAV9HAZ1_9PEZI|nr:hypothetical protein QBC42DRAFT_279238 [Cladorrhinum samala]
MISGNQWRLHLFFFFLFFLFPKHGSLVMDPLLRRRREWKLLRMSCKWHNPPRLLCREELVALLMRGSSFVRGKVCLCPH